jgi:hypothetical protein
MRFHTGTRILWCGFCLWPPSSERSRRATKLRTNGKRLKCYLSRISNRKRSETKPGSDWKDRQPSEHQGCLHRMCWSAVNRLACRRRLCLRPICGLGSKTSLRDKTLIKSINAPEGASADVNSVLLGLGDATLGAPGLDDDSAGPEADQRPTPQSVPLVNAPMVADGPPSPKCRVNVASATISRSACHNHVFIRGGRCHPERIDLPELFLDF